MWQGLGGTTFFAGHITSAHAQYGVGYFDQFTRINSNTALKHAHGARHTAQETKMKVHAKGREKERGRARGG